MARSLVAGLLADGDAARALVLQTLLGAARMLTEDGAAPAELRRRVTSPGGTTQAAIETFEAGGFRDLVARAIRAASERGRQRLNRSRPMSRCFMSRCFIPGARIAFAILPILAATACGGPQPSAPDAAHGSTASTAADRGESVVRIGDTSIRASVVQTSTLPGSVARQYGINRDPGTVLLLVAVRKGPDASAIALPAQITATVTDLRGGHQEIVMRELRAGELLDYVGTLSTTLPETLRFDLKVAADGIGPTTLQFEREFYPQ